MSHLGNLQDGFHELLTFRGHKLHIKGSNLVENKDEKKQLMEANEKMQFVSWDAKQAMLWESDMSSLRAKCLHQVKYSNQPNFICSITHIRKLKVFLASALDMTFKIYDRNLSLLEAIHHEERAILQLEYDYAKDIILTSGASGISVWRLFRNTTLDHAHIMEKLFAFEGCTSWVTKMIYEPAFNRVYAIRDRSAQVLSLSKRCIISDLNDVHDSPLSVVCWYNRNQFYLTGCSRGEIKCWTSNHQQKAGGGGGGSLSSSKGGKVFALLHVFKAHVKTVTCIKLHPVSGLAITASLDGTMKVLNLEALTELFCIDLAHGVLDVKILPLDASRNTHCALVSLTNTTIRLLKIFTMCSFFGTSSTTVGDIQVFDDIQAEIAQRHKLLIRDASDASMNGEFVLLNKTLVGHDGGFNSAALLAAGVGGTRGADTRKGSILGGRVGNNSDDDDDDDEGFDSRGNSAAVSVRDAAYNSNNKGSALRHSKIVVASSLQDMRLFAPSGQLVNKLDPEFLVNGIVAYTVSVYQNVLFCLCENDTVRAHDLAALGCPLVAEVALNSTLDIGLCTSILLVNCDPNIGIQKAEGGEGGGGGKVGKVKHSVRGEMIDNFIKESLLIGMKTGTVLVLDTLNQLDTTLSMQGHSNGIVEMKYKQSTQELFVLGKDPHVKQFTIRLWKLPNMELIGDLSGVTSVTCFNFSMKYSIFACGVADGNLRVYLYRDNEVQDNKRIEEENEAALRTASNKHRGVLQQNHQKLQEHELQQREKQHQYQPAFPQLPDRDYSLDRLAIMEVSKHGSNHDAELNGVAFNDNLKIIVTSSMDYSIKIWDFGKTLVRNIKLNNYSCNAHWFGDEAKVLLSQGNYLLFITRDIWDDGSALAYSQKAKDQWEEGELDEGWLLRSMGLCLNSDGSSMEPASSSSSSLAAAATAAAQELHQHGLNSNGSPKKEGVHEGAGVFSQAAGVTSHHAATGSQHHEFGTHGSTAATSTLQESTAEVTKAAAVAAAAASAVEGGTGSAPAAVGGDGTSVSQQNSPNKDAVDKSGTSPTVPSLHGGTVVPDDSKYDSINSTAQFLTTRQHTSSSATLSTPASVSAAVGAKNRRFSSRGASGVGFVVRVHHMAQHAHDKHLAHMARSKDGGGGGVVDLGDIADDEDSNLQQRDDETGGGDRDQYRKKKNSMSADVLNSSPRESPKSHGIRKTLLEGLKGENHQREKGSSNLTTESPQGRARGNSSSFDANVQEINGRSGSTSSGKAFVTQKRLKEFAEPIFAPSEVEQMLSAVTAAGNVEYIRTGLHTPLMTIDNHSNYDIPAGQVQYDREQLQYKYLKNQQYQYKQQQQQQSQQKGPAASHIVSNYIGSASGSEINANNIFAPQAPKVAAPSSKSRGVNSSKNNTTSVTFHKEEEDAEVEEGEEGEEISSSKRESHKTYRQMHDDVQYGQHHNYQHHEVRYAKHYEEPIHHARPEHYHMPGQQQQLQHQYSSSIASKQQTNGCTVSHSTPLDVHHPRYLIHKKPVTRVAAAPSLSEQTIMNVASCAAVNALEAERQRRLSSGDMYDIDMKNEDDIAVNAVHNETSPTSIMLGGVLLADAGTTSSAGTGTGYGDDIRGNRNRAVNFSKEALLQLVSSVQTRPPEREELRYHHQQQQQQRQQPLQHQIGSASQRSSHQSKLTSEEVTARIAMLGMSPRARLTMLSLQQQNPYQQQQQQQQQQNSQGRDDVDDIDSRVDDINESELLRIQEKNRILAVLNREKDKIMLAGVNTQVSTVYKQHKASQRAKSDREFFRRIEQQYQQQQEAERIQFENMTAAAAAAADVNNDSPAGGSSIKKDGTGAGNVVLAGIRRNRNNVLSRQSKDYENSSSSEPSPINLPIM